MKVLILMFAAVIASSQTAELPTIADAIAVRTLQWKLTRSQLALERIMSDPVIIAAKASVQAAQEALSEEVKKHPGCQLQDDNAWKCGNVKQ